MTEALAIAEALRPTLLRLSRRIRQQAVGQDLSANDIVLMGHIRRNRGVGVSGLADMAGASRPTISSQVKRLDALGFLARLPDPDDARRAGLTITPLGIRRLEAIKRKRTDWLASRLAALSDEDRQSLGEAAAALERLADAS